jgi:hypothetical protein
VFRLLHLELQLDLVDRFKPKSVKDSLYEALGGSVSPSIHMPPMESPFALRSITEKQYIRWAPESCTVIIEAITDHKDCLERILKLYERIDKVAPLRKLKKRQLITHWILPTQQHGSFASLEQAYRRNLIIHKPVWDDAVDSSFICDLLINGVKVHHQSGAMSADQLKRQYAIFENDSIPDLFLFLLIAAYNEDVVEYAPDHLNEFLDTSYEACDRHRKLFDNIWEGII